MKKPLLMLAVVAVVVLLLATVSMFFGPPVQVSVQRELVQSENNQLWYLLDQRANLAEIKTAMSDGGTDINATDVLGVSILGNAVRDGRIDLATWLLEQGADPNGGHPSVAPLVGAIREGDLEMVELLLSHGADPDLDRGGGSTPLRLARLIEADRKIIRALERARE